ncbi:hypothetical protein CTI12_AA219250 [Artemisia annua]|uniref:Integrase catalytic domain-containing protein n=1 Tax=Artemisia annua TaxID=35608 RepID=A0A2U1NLC8_ARTAN|nr:hypothetical protein CTI12_AA219250 [Artemisia annua]
MVTTRNTTSHNEQPNHTDTSSPLQNPDNLAQQLSSIASKLNALDALAADVAVLKAQAGPSGSYRGKSKETTFGSRHGDDDSESSGWYHNSTRRPFTKMEFPKFEGGDPRGWILKAEKYFRYYQTPDESKVEIASMYLEGDALDLFAWISAENNHLYWEELVKILHENYGPAEFQNPDEHLCNIKQTGTVQEYRQEFAKRVARVHDWPDHCLLGVFLSGLKEELKVDVRIHKPKNVFKAVSLALEFEEKSRPDSNPRISNSFNYNKPSSYSTSSSDPDKLSATSQNTSSSTQSKNWESERQNRRDKGLCFRCNEKFAPGHRCRQSTFSLLEISNDNEQLADREVEADKNEHEERINQQDMAEISFHAILGKTSGTTMKVEGTLEGRKVLILIDSGSTHNFISTSLVKQLGLKVSTVPSFGVQIGNGQIIQCNQICCDLSLVLPGLKITEDYFPFSIGGADLVLGIKWLASLNTVQANWNEMFMIFYVNGKKYKLQGVPSVAKTDVSLQCYSKLSDATSDSPQTRVEIPAKSVAALFCKEIVRLHGMPRSIISDRDVVFLSNFWQELFRLSQTRLRMGTAYHPQPDGQTEVVNCCLEAYLRCFAHERPSSWNKFLAWAEYLFSMGYHTSSETTPFKSIYGHDPPPLTPYVQGETQNADLEEQLVARDDALQLLRSNLLKAQSRMKAQSDSKRRELSFEVGDAVLLRIQPFRQRSLSKRKFEKLSPRYFGPYTVTRRVVLVAYELALPADSKVHPISHVSLLHWAHGQSVSQPSAPLPITADWEQIIVPDKILTHHWIPRSNNLELLVQWQHRPLEDATREDYDLLAGQYPQFCLEDKASFQGGSTDKNLLTYFRRKKAYGKIKEINQDHKSVPDLQQYDLS